MQFSNQFPVRVLVALTAMLLIFGCSESTPELVRVKGRVTYRGRAVPAGYVALNPDRREGNSGTQGFAAICQGAFDTGASNGVNAAPGKVRVVISGYDGKAGPDPESLGNPLFASYEMRAEIRPDMGDLDIHIP